MLLQHYLLLATFRSTYKGTNEAIEAHLFVPTDKVQQHDPAIVPPSDGSAVPCREISVSKDVGIQHKSVYENSSIPLAVDGSKAPSGRPSPEEQIQQILDLETSLEVDTRQPWKDHDFEGGPCDKDTAYQLGNLLAFLAPTYRDRILPEMNHHKNGKASFKNLWILFQPGIDVYGYLNGEYLGFVVQSCEIQDGDKSAKKREEQEKRCAITVWSLKYTGDRIYRQARRFHVPEFDGTRDIASFEVFPTRYLKNTQRLSELRQRGEKYVNIIRQNPAHRAYDGHTLERASKKASIPLALTVGLL